MEGGREQKVEGNVMGASIWNDGGRERRKGTLQFGMITFTTAKKFRDDAALGGPSLHNAGQQQQQHDVGGGSLEEFTHHLKQKCKIKSNDKYNS